LRDINLENNPNVTFWQYLRSRNTEGGRNFNLLIQNSGLLYDMAPNYGEIQKIN
jgi:hypothetical protein